MRTDIPIDARTMVRERTSEKCTLIRTGHSLSGRWMFPYKETGLIGIIFFIAERVHVLSYLSLVSFPAKSRHL